MPQAMELTNLEAAIVRILEEHRGRESAISRKELIERINSELPVFFRVSDRTLRMAIKHLQSQHGERIGSCGKGYFMTETAQELEEVCAYYDSYGLSSLHVSARLRRMALPELLGQMKLRMEGQ